MQPTIINGYTLQHLLGEGGMANVYFAKNRIGKTAAIKILKAEFMAQPAIKQRFWQDAEIMATLKHSAIREVYDFVEGEGYMAIIMEYLDGSDLNDRIKQTGALPEAEATKLMLPILDAFQYAHSKGIVHRDVKPSNVFLTKDGQVKIIDFGIAKIDDGNHEWTRTHMKMGTPAYMSPEQILTPRNVDFRADIYSLGVLLFTLLAGKKPYDEATNSDYLIQDKVVREALPILGMSSDLMNEIVAKATRKKREERFQSCNEMKAYFAKSANTSTSQKPPIFEEHTIIDMTFQHEEPVVVIDTPRPNRMPLQTPPPIILPQNYGQNNTNNQQNDPSNLPVSSQQQTNNLPTKSKGLNWIQWVGLILLIPIGLAVFNYYNSNKEYITSTSTASVSSELGNMQLTGDKVNVRSSADLNADNITFQLPADIVVNATNSIIDNRGVTWYEINYNGNQGWISSKTATSTTNTVTMPNIPEAKLNQILAGYRDAVNRADIDAVLSYWSDTPSRYYGQVNPSKYDMQQVIAASRCWGSSKEGASDYVYVPYGNGYSVYYMVTFQCNPNGSEEKDTRVRSIRTRIDINSNGKITYAAPTSYSNK